MILTSNYSPPNDGAHNRRFLSIHLSEEEKKEIEEQEAFKKLLDENKNCISILGDFTASYIRDHPSILLDKAWNDIAKEILVHFYDFVDIPVPEWIEYLEEQRDAIDESSEKTLFELRSFLMNRINDAYVKHKKFDSSTWDKIDINAKLVYCLDNKIIPFLSAKEENILIITVDIMRELGLNQGIENITSLKDVGSLINFEYTYRYVNGKKMRVLVGTKESIIKFIDGI
jgi:hypothetical protein